MIVPEDCPQAYDMLNEACRECTNGEKPIPGGRYCTQDAEFYETEVPDSESYETVPTSGPEVSDSETEAGSEYNLSLEEIDREIADLQERGKQISMMILLEIGARLNLVDDNSLWQQSGEHQNFQEYAVNTHGIQYARVKQLQGVAREFYHLLAEKNHGPEKAVEHNRLRDLVPLVKGSDNETKKEAIERATMLRPAEWQSYIREAKGKTPPDDTSHTCDLEYFACCRICGKWTRLES